MGIDLEADVEAHGMLGHDRTVRNGITDIRYTVTIQNPAPEEKVCRCRRPWTCDPRWPRARLLRGRAVRRTRAELGRLDVLVNKAGMRLYQPADASEESWDAIPGVNLKGYAFCAKAAIPKMRLTGGGSIVNVASVRSVVVGGNTPQHDTTKAAVAGLTRALAIDHAGEGIRVNAACPGPIFTRFHERRATTAGERSEEFKAEFGRNTMLKRPGTPRQVAACILFLASDEASWVTGTCLFVDAGQAAM